MTAAAEPRQQVVLLEPRDRAQFDRERAALVVSVEQQLPAVIETQEQYLLVAGLESKVDAFIDKMAPIFDEHCTEAYRVWKQACEIRSMFLDVPKQLKVAARSLLGAFRQAEAQRRHDEERRIAEEERLREIARQKADAKLAERQGQPELAAAIRAQPITTTPVVLPSAVPHVEGLTFREDWCWEPIGGDTPANRVRSLMLIVRPEFLPLLKWDDGALTQFARRTKGTIKVPGIRFFSKQVPVRR